MQVPSLAGSVDNCLSALAGLPAIGTSAVAKMKPQKKRKTMEAKAGLLILAKRARCISPLHVHAPRDALCCCSDLVSTHVT
jgi:hypothetical protein